MQLLLNVFETISSLVCLYRTIDNVIFVFAIAVFLQGSQNYWSNT